MLFEQDSEEGEDNQGYGADLDGLEGISEGTSILSSSAFVPHTFFRELEYSG